MMRRCLRARAGPPTSRAWALRWLAVALLVLAPATVALADEPALPASVDLRPWLEERGLGPRRQGPRGTCSVFTMVGAIEAALARAEGRGVRLSVEYLNWAANEASGRASDGQFFHTAWAGFERFGIAEEEAMPYRARFERDHAPSEEARRSALARARRLRLELRWIKPNDGTKGVSPAHLAETRAVLARGLPVAAGSHHSVLFVGYEDDPKSPGGGFFRTYDSGSGRAGKMAYAEALGRLCDICWVEGVVVAEPGAREAPAPGSAEAGPGPAAERESP